MLVFIFFKNTVKLNFFVIRAAARFESATVNVISGVADITGGSENMTGTFGSVPGLLYNTNMSVLILVNGNNISSTCILNVPAISEKKKSSDENKYYKSTVHRKVRKKYNCLQKGTFLLSLGAFTLIFTYY